MNEKFQTQDQKFLTLMDTFTIKDDKKMQAMKKYIKDHNLWTNIICSLKSDELKIQALDRIVVEEGARLAVIKSIISEDKKLYVMDQSVLVDDDRLEVLKTLPEARQLELMNAYIWLLEYFCSLVD